MVGWGSDRSPWDLPEDPADSFSEASDHQGESEWVSGRTLGEILCFDLKMLSGTASCPRCGKRLFAYGRLQFCSHDCPENLLQRGPSS